MDIVIPLRISRSPQDNLELKYSLRSLQKNIKVGSVFIVTDQVGLPKWIDNVVHIPYPDMGSVGLVNTTKKILKACEDKRLGETFLLSNDDFFLLKNFDHPFPYYYKGDLPPGPSIKKEHVYITALKKTQFELRKRGYSFRNFELHCPIVFEKSKLSKCLEIFDLDKGSGLFPRSVYGNLFNIPAELRQDYIVNLPLNPKRPISEQLFFSVPHVTLSGAMEDFLEELYPDKSDFEKQQS